MKWESDLYDPEGDILIKWASGSSKTAYRVTRRDLPELDGLLLS